MAQRLKSLSSFIISYYITTIIALCWNIYVYAYHYHHQHYHHHHNLPPDERITSHRDQPSHGFHQCRQSRKRSHTIHKKEAPGKSLSPSSTLNVVTFFFNECLLLSEMKISVLPIKKEVHDTQHYISTETLLVLRDCKNDEGLVIQKMGMW